MQHDPNSLPPRITLEQATVLAGYRRRNTVRELFLRTDEDRIRLKHAYNDNGQATIDTTLYLEELRQWRAERAAKGNWRLANLERANQARRRNAKKKRPRRAE